MYFLRFAVLVHITISCANIYGGETAQNAPPPSIAPFRSSDWVERIDGKKNYTYDFSRTTLTPSREWLFFTVYEAREAAANWAEYKGRVAAIGAYQLRTGKTFQLTLSSAIQGAEICDNVFPLGNGCGFIVRQSAPMVRGSDNSRKNGKPGSAEGERAEHGNGDQGTAEYSYFLWKWDADRNTATLVRLWDDSMTRVARAVGLEHCDVSWKADTGDEPTRGVLSVLDRQSQKSVSVALETAFPVIPTASQTFTATNEPQAVAICDATQTDNISVFCIDPNKPNGIRWKWSHHDLETKVGREIEGAAFLPSMAFPAAHLSLVVNCLRDDSPSAHLLILKPADGTVVRQYEFPNRYNSDMGFDDDRIAISPDARKVAIVFYKSPDTVDKRLAVIDLDLPRDKESGSLVEDTAGDLTIVGFADNTHVIVSSDKAIWTVDIAGDLSLKQRLLRLPDDAIGATGMPLGGPM